MKTIVEFESTPPSGWVGRITGPRGGRDLRASDFEGIMSAVREAFAAVGEAWPVPPAPPAPPVAPQPEPPQQVREPGQPLLPPISKAQAAKMRAAADDAILAAASPETRSAILARQAEARSRRAR